MAAQFGLVVQPAQAHALEFAAQRAGDRLAQRRLAHARRADEAEDRRLGLRVQLEHGQVFEDALLDVREVEVVLVENLPGVVRSRSSSVAFFHGSSSTSSRYVRVT